MSSLSRIQAHKADLLILAGLLLASRSSSGTSIVALWGGGQVIVAADSKVEDGRLPNDCKIVVESGAIAAFSGLVAIYPWFDALG